MILIIPVNINNKVLSVLVNAVKINIAITADRTFKASPIYRPYLVISAAIST